MKKQFKQIFGSVLLVTFGVTSVFAHDLWLEKKGAENVLLSGHRHSSHHEDEILPYEASFVKHFVCLTSAGKTKNIDAGKKYPVATKEACATFQVQFSSGYWTKTAHDTQNIPHTGISGVIKSYLSVEDLKYIAAWTKNSAKPLGIGLEMTPQNNPLRLKEGDQLTLLVTHEGRAISGVEIGYADLPLGVTDQQGMIQIPIHQAPLHMVEAVLETPLNDGKGQLTRFAATLQFSLAK